MNYAMEIHDSCLEEVICNTDGTGYALFNASIFRSEGQVFKGADESGWQKLRFDFEGMQIEGEVGELKTWASGGTLCVDDVEQKHAIFLPANHEGKIVFEMCLLDDDRILKIHARKVRSNLIGEFELEGRWDASGNFTRANA